MIVHNEVEYSRLLLEQDSLNVNAKTELANANEG